LKLKPTIKDDESNDTQDDDSMPIITNENNVIQAQDPSYRI